MLPQYQYFSFYEICDFQKKSSNFNSNKIENYRESVNKLS